MKRYFLLLFFIIALVDTMAQSEADLSQTPGRWVYANENSSKDWFGSVHYKMTPSELQQYNSKTDQLVSYFKSQAIAQKPMGITLNAKSRAGYLNYDHGDHPVKMTERIQQSLVIQFCPLMQSEGKVIEFCTEVPTLDIATNDPFASYESTMNFDKLEDIEARHKLDELFTTPKQILDLGKGVYAYDWYYYNKVVVSKPGQPWFVPITTKELIDRQKAYFAAALKEGKVDVTTMALINKELRDVPAELMDQPAYTGTFEDRPFFGIGYKDENGVAGICKFNPEYFDKKLPRIKVQLLTISYRGSIDNEHELKETDHIRLMAYVKALKGEDLLKLLDVE